MSVSCKNSLSDEATTVRFFTISDLFVLSKVTVAVTSSPATTLVLDNLYDLTITFGSKEGVVSGSVSGSSSVIGSVSFRFFPSLTVT